MSNIFEVNVKLTNHSVSHYIKVSLKVFKRFYNLSTVSNKFW